MGSVLQPFVSLDLRLWSMLTASKYIYAFSTCLGGLTVDLLHKVWDIYVCNRDILRLLSLMRSRRHMTDDCFDWTCRKVWVEIGSLFFIPLMNLISLFGVSDYVIAFWMWSNFKFLMDLDNFSDVNYRVKKRSDLSNQYINSNISIINHNLITHWPCIHNLLQLAWSVIHFE